MKIIVLAAGQGTRLRPLTDDKPKCMVEINGRSIIERQLDVFERNGVEEKDICILTGYKDDVLKNHLRDKNVNFIKNDNFETTNMVCTLMCAKELINSEDEIIISYGDIVYSDDIFNKIKNSSKDISVIVDEGWLSYWQKRCDNPLDDAETLKINENGELTEIGQKTNDLKDVQAQYIGLMKFKGNGIKKMVELCQEAERRSANGENLWRTTRNYNKMYMTDLLQGLIDTGVKLDAVKINRGWYEVDCVDDLKIAEEEMK